MGDDDHEEAGYEPIPVFTASIEKNSKGYNWKISVLGAPDRKTLRIMLTQGYDEVQDLIRADKQTGGN